MKYLLTLLFCASAFGADVGEVKRFDSGMVWGGLRQGTFNNQRSLGFGSVSTTPTNRGAPAVVWSTGHTALILSRASSDYVYVSNSTALNPGTSPVTLCAWVNLPNTNQWGIILQKRSGINFSLFSMSVGENANVGSAGKRLNASVAGSTAGSLVVSTTDLFADGKNHFFAAVFAGGASRVVNLYVDGVSRTYNTDANSAGTINCIPEGDLYIGNNSTMFNTLLNGKVWGVRIFHRILSAAEINAIYTSELR